MNMSFNLTIESCRQFIKTVTRRNDSTWTRLKPLDVLQQVEKAQGLKRGEKIKPIHKIVVLDIRRESLVKMLAFPDYGRAECILEGFPNLTGTQFVEMYCKHNKTFPAVPQKRIEFRYLLPMDGSQSLAVPLAIAACPSCGAGLTIHPDGWTEAEKDIQPEKAKMSRGVKTYWHCDSFSTLCNNEPDNIDSQQWENWDSSHAGVSPESGYAFESWFPIQQKIDTWLYKTFRFEDIETKESIKHE